MVATDSLSLVFGGALADPTRREILTRLAQGGPATVGEVAEPFAMSAPPAISQHLKVLERAGLVTRTAHAQWRTLTLQAEPWMRPRPGWSGSAASGICGWTRSRPTWKPCRPHRPTTQPPEAEQ